MEAITANLHVAIISTGCSNLRAAQVTPGRDDSGSPGLAVVGPLLSRPLACSISLPYLCSCLLLLRSSLCLKFRSLKFLPLSLLSSSSFPFSLSPSLHFFVFASIFLSYLSSQFISIPLSFVLTLHNGTAARPFRTICIYSHLS